MSITHRKLHIRHTAATCRAYAQLFRNASLLWISANPIRTYAFRKLYLPLCVSIVQTQRNHLSTYVCMWVLPCTVSCLAGHNVFQLELVSSMSLHSPIMVHGFKLLWWCCHTVHLFNVVGSLWAYTSCPCVLSIGSHSSVECHVLRIDSWAVFSVVFKTIDWIEHVQLHNFVIRQVQIDSSVLSNSCSVHMY